MVEVIAGVDKYQLALEAAFSGENGGVVSNLSVGHAWQLHKFLFCAGHVTADLLCQNLNSDVFQNVAPSAISFLERGGRLRILLENKIEWAELAAHPFISQLLLGAPLDKFEIRYSPESLKSDFIPQNFSVVDSEHGREEDSRGEIAAEGFFHNPLRAAGLQKRFDDLYSRSKDILGRDESPAIIDLELKTEDDFYLFQSSSAFPGILVGDHDLEEAISALPDAASLLVEARLGRVSHYQVVRREAPVRFQLVLSDN